MGIFAGRSINAYVVKTVLIGVALLFIVGTYTYNVFFKEPVRRGEPAQATIVANVQDSTTNGQGDKVQIYTAVLEFNANGETVKTKYGLMTKEKPYEIGERVAIEYDPADPTRVYLVPKRGFQAMYLLGVLAVPFILRLFLPVLARRLYGKIMGLYGH